MTSSTDGREDQEAPVVRIFDGEKDPRLGSPSERERDDDPSPSMDRIINEMGRGMWTYLYFVIACACEFLLLESSFRTNLLRDSENLRKQKLWIYRFISLSLRFLLTKIEWYLSQWNHCSGSWKLSLCNCNYACELILLSNVYRTLSRIIHSNDIHCAYRFSVSVYFSNFADQSWNCLIFRFLNYLCFNPFDKSCLLCYYRYCDWGG